MQKKIATIFIVVCLCICIIPFACMFFDGESRLIGNETKTELPSLSNEDGTVNESFLNNLGTYFEKNYAFRPELITADALIQANVFLVSNTDSVVVGNNGWLYYASTLDDYMGKNSLSERGMWNLAHNIRLIQDYAESEGKEFLIMIPANKNSLYGENMPYYYSCRAGDLSNRDSLKEYMEEFDINYLDLFSLFESQSEAGYLKDDSHWDMKGALLVYENTMNAIGKVHREYDIESGNQYTQTTGDLSDMIYPAIYIKDTNYCYDVEQNFEYVPNANAQTAEVSVEDTRINTVNGNAEGSLIMYRDSFGNSLIPLIANEFNTAYFSKGTPYNFVLDFSTHEADCVIIEKVERNLRHFVSEPAIIESPSADISGIELQEADSDIQIENCLYYSAFIEIKGSVEKLNSPDDRIFVGICDGSGEEIVYEAFNTSDENSDLGYLVYVPMEEYGSVEALETLEVRIYTGK